MRAIATILLLFVVGCGKDGPTSKEATVVYEAEVKKLTLLEEHLKSAKSDLEQHPEIDRQIQESHEAANAFKPNKETAGQLDELHTKMEKSQSDIKQLIKKQIESLNSLIATQKQRVEAARKAMDAAE